MSDEQDIYDDPEMQTSTGFVKFEKVGDKVEGVVVQVERGEDFNGKPCPQYTIRLASGDNITLTAGQANLKRQVVEKRVAPGQYLSVEYTSNQKAAKGQMKVFTVEVSDPKPTGVSADSLV